MTVGFMILFEKNCSVENDISLPNGAIRQNIAFSLIMFLLSTFGSKAQFLFTWRDSLIWAPDLFSIFCTFIHWNFSKYIFKTFCSKVGSTEIWTRVFGLRVQGANHYTIEPITLFFEIEIVTNVCWLHDSFWKELFGKNWYFSPKWCEETEHCLMF